jgi:hypothetical protein
MPVRATPSIPIAAALSLALNLPSVAAAVDFSRDIQPILSTSCFECHGPDPSSRQAELRLDTREGAVAEGMDGPIIVPGEADESALIARITADDPNLRMPPGDRKAALTPEQVQLLRQWIDAGAPFDEHWAFRPVKRPAPPAVQDNAWLQAPVDNFVLRGLEQANLKPAPAATRETLIRRATLDLIGLPPTPAEVEAFLADDSPDAFAKLVDRLLASPHYGERWARHWLDVARYADSGGFETDIFFGHAWRYRDYVIRALNDDKPYDDFIREQIAGEELYPGDMNARVAAGFYTIGPILQEADMVEGKLDNDLLTDAVDATASAFLGLTIGCARCHDHKYDPVSQRDYYAMQAIFAASEQTDFDEAGKVLRTGVALRKTIDQYKLEQLKTAARAAKEPDERDRLLREVGESYIEQDEELQERFEQSEAYADYNKARRQYRELSEQTADPEQAAELLREIGEHAMTLAGQDRRALRRMSREERNAYLIDFGRKNLALSPPDELIDDVDAFRLAIGRENLEGPSTIPVRTLTHRESPLTIRLLGRGELTMPGEEVPPAIPEHLNASRLRLSELPADERRAALANWIASKENPLTARVMVNRVWQGHFGAGLVRTPNDFGIRGERPTHPELLDWLAAEFMEHGWSLKHLHRTIMLSSAYQMSCETDAATLARDPDNRLLTRYQPHRLEAEPIWDSIRAVAGTLNREMYGLPVAPPLDEQETIGNYKDWPTSTPDQVNRRGIYLLTRRSFRFPMLSSFDLPENTASCGRRDTTTVPNQCLALLNNRTLHEQAAAFAERLLEETGGKLRAVPDRAWLHAYGRAITDEEQERVDGFLALRLGELNQDSKDDQTAARSALTELCLAIFNTNEFIFIQ